MSKIFEKLSDFLQVDVYEKESEYDENTFEIIDADSDEGIGSYSLNEKGELVGFSLFDEPIDGNLKKDQVSAIAQKFVDAFYPGQQEFELSGILDLDNPYMVTYEKRDEKYGIFIHSTGFTVSVSTSGQVTSFYYADEDYEVRYTDIVVSEEEALEKYSDGLEFELHIQKFDREVYENGDNNYHLAYSVIEQLMEIPVDGSETSSIREEFDIDAPLEKMEVPNQNIYDLIGLTTEYKLLETKIEKGRRIEIWSTLDSVEEYSFDMDETDDHITKLCFDEKTNLLLQVVSGEEHENDRDEIGLDSARVRALEVMFKLFPDTHERFRLEISEYENEDFEDEIEEEDFEDEEFLDEEFDEEEFDDEDWDEEFIEHEDSYTFYFHLHHKGIRVDQHVSLISVGKYTGRITHVNVDNPSENLYTTLSVTPTISTNEAKDIYKKHLKMELMFIREYDEDGKSIYTLAYVPDFPETVGHVRAIDAVTGKAMYVDVGDASFLK